MALLSPAMWLIATVTALAGMVFGAVARTLWTRWVAKKQRKIPRNWPLNPRLVANTEEKKVWVWMNRVFFDHHILLKLPVTRFTLPQSQNQGQHWFKLLSSVYCTFTVCTPGGRVVGCVDVPGRAGLSRGNRQLKLTLLSQCGIAYWVIRSNDLPTLTEIREEFLGTVNSTTKSAEKEEASVKAIRLKLQTSLELQRRQRSKETLSATAGDPGSSYGTGHAYSQHNNYGSGGGDWQQKNSFLGALDSRAVDLR